ncbi:MAG TPA: folylpolyglutamate synthase/dihydrofolate synthase family protein [Candidatus Hydrogenedentes bacterium]|nr:folylpolyglutamate synthase/dihydrofolate synthase family protein [Candidatus Hydrogenedentota bacterium]
MSEAIPRNSYSDLREYLFGLSLHGIKLGLHNIQTLLRAAGNPEQGHPAVHVAGTNGKGSVTALIGAMLRASGLRVGRFTSPHIIDLPERFQIDGLCIPEDALARHTEFFRRAAESLASPPTFFELNTAIAFRWFAEEGVDVAVIEVGMGGRLDSTNVIRPLVSVITNIDYEHTQYLGDTLEKIAFEKAGILKDKVPAVAGERRPGPLGVILDRARELECGVRVLGRDFQYSVCGSAWEQDFSYSSDTLYIEDASLGLPGRYQGENAAVAVAAAELLQGHFPALNVESIVHGLSGARWPCRLERVLEDPPVVIDVAHNVAGARRLAETIDRCVVVMAVASDKDAAGMVEVLAPHSELMILTVFDGKRALPLEQLCHAAGDHPHVTAGNLHEAIALGMKQAKREVPLLITGSIYTAGEARQLLIEQYGAAPLVF